MLASTNDKDTKTVDLWQFAYNTYSQFGEDGILEKICELLGIEQGFFVEFGAWDGEHLSNCRLLIDKDWSGCLIEGDPSRYADLCKNISQDSVIKLNEFVAIHGPNSLDNLLLENGIARVDLLSIDIDSDDLAIWQSVKNFRPTIVVVEFNPTVPFDTHFVNTPGCNYGNSALSILEFADSKGYQLVAGTKTNLIFVASETPNSSLLPKASLEEIKRRFQQKRFFFGFDGTLLTESSTLRNSGITELYKIPWLGLGRQPIPKFLRTYSDQNSVRSFLRDYMFLPLLALLQSPFQFVSLVIANSRRKKRKRSS